MDKDGDAKINGSGVRQKKGLRLETVMADDEFIPELRQRNEELNK
jgi:hypothetical protein